MCAVFSPKKEPRCREKNKQGAPIKRKTCPMLGVCVHLWFSFRMMSAMVRFIVLRFGFGFWFRRSHVAHHSLHHGASTFFHLLHVRSNLVAEFSELLRIFRRQRQSRAVFDRFIGHCSRQHLTLHHSFVGRFS